MRELKQPTVRSLFGRRRKRPTQRVYRPTSGFEELEARELLAVASVETLNPVNMSGFTGEKPQSKLWEQNGVWWGVWSITDGAYLHRLDGATWQPVLKLASTTSVKADVRPHGDVTHVLLQRDGLLQLVSLEYVAGSPPTYRLWSDRPSITTLTLPIEPETATLELDSTGRMWLAYDSANKIEVRYSDAPYTSWSGPIVLATNVDDDDIAVITALPSGKIGVLWSNQTTKRFGFRTHTDGANPNVWSSDETPAAQSAQNIGGGMADDHLNVAVAADGTLFAAVKTSFDTEGATQLGLLVRRPNGTWDPLHPIDTVGTRPSIQLSSDGESFIYSYRIDTAEPIVYRECSTSTLTCTERRTLLTDPMANNVSSTRQTYHDDLVLIAANDRGKLFGARLRFANVPNQAPVVNAGPDQAFSGASAVLYGSVSDDGLPNPPQKIETLWTQVSGPGQAIFADPTVPITSVAFDRPGPYVLRLTASDGDLTSYDEVMVDVLTPIAPVLVASFRDGQSPDANYMGTQDTTIMSDWPSKRFGSEDQLEMDGSPDAAALIRWDISYIPAGSAVVDVTMTFHVPNASPSTFRIYELKRPWSESEATWGQAANGAAWEKAGAQGEADRGSTPLGEVTITSTGKATVRLNAAGVAVVQRWVNNPETNYGFVIQDYANVNDNRLYFDSRETNVVANRPELEIAYRPNQLPVVNAGSDQTIVFGGIATLQGQVDTSGMSGASGDLQILWTRVSGPGAVAFGDATAAQTTAIFSQPGAYVLRLTASDDHVSVSDDVVVIVEPAALETLAFRQGVWPSSNYNGVQDTTIASDEPNTNFGDEMVLEMDGEPDMAALVRWDISAIPQGVVVQSVKLTFHVPNGSPQTFKIYELKRPWNESQATWRDASAVVRWQSAGAAGATDRGSTVLGEVTASIGVIEIDLNAAGVAVVQNWINNPSKNYGFLIGEYSDANENRLYFTSSEAPIADHRPTLTIRYAPQGAGQNLLPESERRDLSAPLSRTDSADAPVEPLWGVCRPGQLVFDDLPAANTLRSEEALAANLGEAERVALAASRPRAFANEAVDVLMLATHGADPWWMQDEELLGDVLNPPKTS